MSQKKLDTPVLFLIFNRPDTTQQVFDAIRQAKPSHLYVAADGAREDHEEDLEKVKEVRGIATDVDWPCKVKTLFREENLGCKYAVSGAIDWFFEHEDQGIILEDDCLPAESFFWFCQNMLDRYRDDTRIWQISGTTFFPDAISLKSADYFFSRYGPIWGWATWKRAWENYDVELSSWPEMRQQVNLINIYSNINERFSKYNIGERLYKKNFDTWDYQWALIKAYNNALTILPKMNQIVNIGIRGDATHTKVSQNDEPISKYEIIDLKHPNFVMPDRLYEKYYASNKFKKNNLVKRIINKLRITNNN